MKSFAAILGAIVLAVGLMPMGSEAQKQMPKSTKSVKIAKTGKFAHFIPRDKMRAKQQYKRAFLPNRTQVPATVLPVDSTNNQQVSAPMYGNDQYGDCGMAMAAHTIGIYSYGQGKRTEIVWNPDTPLINQYLAISGGDNGMDEDMEVGPSGVFTVGVGGNPLAIAVSSLDVDPNDQQLCQYLLDQFYTLQLAWSVPDAFINNFSGNGQQFLSAMTPDPNNGHYITVSDITKEGYNVGWTWGSWFVFSQSFLASVQPSYFVVFSPLQFDPKTGYDSHGRHITTQAAVWVSIGGSTIPASVISAFPPAGNPPVPVPVPPGPVPPGPVPVPPPGPAPVPGGTFSITIPGQSFTIPGQTITTGGLFRKGTVTTAPVSITLPDQTVSGTITQSR